MLDRIIGTEDQRARLTKATAYGAWWLAFGLTVMNTVLRLIDPLSPIAALFGVPIVFLIGIGIAAGLSLSRTRLAGTIAGVFESGLKAATALQANVVASAAMVEVDTEGIIQQVEHAEVIGWERDSLVGHPLEDIIPDRFLRDHRRGFAEFQKSGESRIAGATVNVPVLGRDGRERLMRLSVARMGDTFLGTLVPIEQTLYNGVPPEQWADTIVERRQREDTAAAGRRGAEDAVIGERREAEDALWESERNGSEEAR